MFGSLKVLQHTAGIKRKGRYITNKQMQLQCTYICFVLGFFPKYVAMTFRFKNTRCLQLINNS